MEFKGKKILIMGFAKSGMAAVKLLRHLGADHIIVTDRKDLADKELLESWGVTVLKQADELFDEDYDLVIKNPGVPYVSPLVKKLTDRNIPVITEVELAYQVAKPQHYVAITGTNGKTTKIGRAHV